MTSEWGATKKHIPVLQEDVLSYLAVKPDGIYLDGTNLTLTATPEAAWLFTGWSGDLVGDYTAISTNLVVDTNKNNTIIHKTIRIFGHKVHPKDSPYPKLSRTHNTADVYICI